MKAYTYGLRAAVVVAALALFSAQAQFRRGGGRFRRDFERIPPELQAQQEEMEKALNPEFREDTFVFPRLKFQEYDSDSQYGWGRLWDDDSPEADLNLIYRLHEVTSMKVLPGLHYTDITIKDLDRYPFVYLAAAGRAVFTEDEAIALRKYMLAGGFMMADDFWGDSQWGHFAEQMRQIFPDRPPVEIGLDNKIFHTVYDFKKEPQIPSVGAYMRTGQSYDPGMPYNEKNENAHYYVIYDDKQRIMALLCHNNHYGDGWEHEGDDESYFDNFSEPMAYPMFINILVYTMSH